MGMLYFYPLTKPFFPGNQQIDGLQTTTLTRELFFELSCLE